MIRIEYPAVYGWDAAIRGMRNPMNSWDKSDSPCAAGFVRPHIGSNDLSLMQKLIRAGSDHSKFMRFIIVTMDITAPLYWWKEYDTYKVGTVANSCSTMHKVHAKEFTLDDFSHEHLAPAVRDRFADVLGVLNFYRHLFIEDKAKAYWWQLIQFLPTSYNQRRTVLLNYAVLRNMYHARKTHKLDEWREFCAFVETLPYAKELICDE